MTTGPAARQRNRKLLHQVATAAHENMERYRTLCEDMPAMICAFLPDGTLTYVNHAYADYFSAGHEELIGRSFLDFLPEDVAREVRQSYLSLTLEKSTCTCSHQLIKNGREVWIEWANRAFFNDQGVAVEFIAVGVDVSERRQAEETLRETKDCYRDLVENSQALIYTHDLNGRILSVNAKVSQVLGYSREELLRMNVRDLLVSGIRGKFDKYLDDILEQQKAQGTVHIQAGDGERRVCQYHGNLRNMGGGPVVCGIAHDITERLRIEKALGKSEILFKKIFEDHGAVKLIIDPDSGRIIDANKAATYFYGWSCEQLRRMTIQEINILPPAEVEEMMERAMAGGQDEFEFRHRRADGSVRNVVVYSSNIKLEGRNVLHSIIHDVTKRKQAEAERERLLAAIEQAGEAICITDVQGAIEYANPAFERITGYNREELLGQNPRILKSGRQDGGFYHELWQTISSGRTWKGRLINKRKDGVLFTEAATISPVTDETGRIVNYAAVKRDITEYLQLTEQFQQLQKLESVGRLAGGVTHDYNNMLTVILGYTEIALTKVGSNESLRADLKEVLQASRRSRDLTRQLLAFARKQTIAPRELDLRETVGGMITMLCRLVGENIELVWTPAPDLKQVEMDPAQFDQILVNLVVNARDAIIGAGKITIAAANVAVDEAHCSTYPGVPPGEYVLLTVSDTGSGMDQETRKYIFEPFFTTKDIGCGNGLGLPTVYGIVHQNRGFIDAYSEPDQGSIFRIYLPCFTGETARFRQDRVDGALTSRRETLMIVDDEPAILKVGQQMLERLGYRVVAAFTPGDALRLAEEHCERIDLLVTDVVMPQMHGNTLARLMKSRHPHLKVLFMSGYTTNTIVHRGEPGHGIHFIEKPFRLEDLAMKVREALKG